MEHQSLLENVKQKARSNRPTILAVILTLILCATAFFVWNTQFREEYDPTEHTEEIARLRSELTTSRVWKDSAFAAYEDSMNSPVLDFQIDTATANLIIQHYEAQKQARSLISPDSSAMLMRSRIRIEPQYNQRFDYNLLDSIRN